MSEDRGGRKIVGGRWMGDAGWFVREALIQPKMNLLFFV